jgi:hypothetical protein
MQQNIIPILVLILIFCLRIRQTIGWQPMNRRKLKVNAALTFMVGVLFIAGGASYVPSLISNAAGIVIGAFLAYYGSKLIRYEQRDRIWFCQSNRWISIFVLLLFGRLLYRIYLMIPHFGDANLTASLSSWTTGLTLIMLTYHVVNNWILIRKLN